MTFGFIFIRVLLASVIGLFTLSESNLFSQNNNNQLLKGDSVIELINDTSQKLIIKKQNTEFKTDTLSSNQKFQIILFKEKETDYLKYFLPILTLILGIIIKYLIDLNSEKKRINKAGKRWVAELKSLEEPIKSQLIKIESFINSRSDKKIQSPSLLIVSGLNCQIFSSLDKSDYLYFLESNKRRGYETAVNISNRTHGLINILIHLFEEIQKRYNQFIDNTSIHVNSYDKNQQILLHRFNDYGILIEKEIKNDPINDPNYSRLYDLMRIHILSVEKPEDYKLLELDVNFFIPFLKILSESRLDERIKPLSEICSSCINDIKAIKMQIKYVIINMTSIKNSYTEQLIDLKDILKDIQSNS